MLATALTPRRLKRKRHQRRRLASGRRDYNYFRDYEPGTGRYIESDPIGLRGSVNTYGYVGSSPLNSIDPSGLVDWNGRMDGGSVSALVGAGIYVFDLVSECVNGKQGRAKVLAVGPVVGASFKPVAFGFSSVSFFDTLDHVDPGVFNGAFVMLSGNLTIATGYGCSAIELGNAYFGDKPHAHNFNHCGDSYGFGVGLEWQQGTATVISSDVWECADGCE
jgi:RHS repeat-associated protein